MGSSKKVNFDKKYSHLSKSDSENQKISKNTSQNKKDLNSELRAENEKLKKHSSHLEKELLISEQKFSLLNHSLLECLHDTQEQLLYYRLQFSNKNIESFVDSPAEVSKGYYGARQRIENELPYRLGRIVIKYSNTPQNITKIPKLLLEEYKDFSQNYDQAHLPPLEDYIDYEEAKKIKQHLTYRVGLAAAESINSPKKTIKLPFELVKQIFLFKKKA